MKTVAGILAVVLAAWLQVSWFGHWRPLGVMPNVMLITVVAFAAWSNATTALAAAIGGGFLLDLASGSDFGLHIAFYAVVVLAIVAGKQLGVQGDSLVTMLLAVVLGTVVYDALILSTLGMPLSPVVFSRIGRELADNLALMILVLIVSVNLPRRTKTTLEIQKGLGE